MNTHYIHYRPKPDELRHLPIYWQVWRGLPNFPYRTERHANGLSSLLYESNGDYIWIPHQALIAYKENPNTVYMALIKRGDRGRMNAIWLLPTKGSLDEATQKAERLNEAIIEGRANGARRPRYRP